MKKRVARKIAEDAAREAVELRSLEVREYSDMSYSVLEIHFAAGSDVLNLSIPYRPFGNRTEINIPMRLMKVEE